MKIYFYTQLHELHTWYDCHTQHIPHCIHNGSKNKTLKNFHLFSPLNWEIHIYKEKASMEENKGLYEIPDSPAYLSKTI